MTMFFDTETTGLPKNWKAPMKDLDNWPRVIQLAWRLDDADEKRLSGGNLLIRPDGWTIPDGSDGKDATFWLKHGFDTAKSMLEGITMTVALEAFIADLQQATYLVSHNMDFDYNVLGAEMLRYFMLSNHKPERICTKELSTSVCKIPFSGQRRWYGSSDRWKWPKLEELHRYLFGRDFDNAHDADGDVAALAACYYELKRRGHIVLGEKEVQP